MFLLSLAKFLSGFAGYIYDIGIVIYLFSQTKSVAAIGGFFTLSVSAGIDYFVYREAY